MSSSFSLSYAPVTDPLRERAASLAPAVNPAPPLARPVTPELVVVVPVYNEESAIVKVLSDWREALGQVLSNYQILVVNDGSKDGTLTALNQLNWPELRIHTHANRGHGQSCLVGYLEADRLGAKYVFQIDSDGQCDPVAFRSLWEKRDQAPAVYGRRCRRDDGLSRKLITRVLKYSLKWFRGTRLNDTNVPYRLYHSHVVAEIAARVPPSFDLANIAVALLMEPKGYIEVPIHFLDRIGGHASVRYWGFARKARRLFRDLRSI